MIVDLNQIEVELPKFYPPQPSDTLVIDNGTYQMKAGYKSDFPQVIIKNKIYKYKEFFSIENKPQSSSKTMFDRDVVTNFEILEGMIDYVLEYLLTLRNEYSETEDEDVVVKQRKTSKGVKEKKAELKVNEYPENIIITTAIYTPKMFQVQMLSLLFEVYKFKKVQIGLDCVYSYFHNFKIEEMATGKMIEKEIVGNKNVFPLRKGKIQYEEIDIIISISNMNTAVLGLQDQKVVKHHRIPFGGKLASEYLLSLIRCKHSNLNLRLTTKETDFLLRYVYTDNDYNEKSMKIFDEMFKGNYNFIIQSRFLEFHEKEDEYMKYIIEDGQAIFKKGKESEKIVYDEGFIKEDDVIQINNENFIVENEPLIYEAGEGNLDTLEKDSVGDNKTEGDDFIDEEELSIADPTANMAENEKMQYYLNIPDVELDEIGLKTKRKYKIIYFSTLYRYKQRIEKYKKQLKHFIELKEEELEKTTDIDKYVSNIKSRFIGLKNDLKKIETTKRELKNKKSKESMVIMKVSGGCLLSKDEERVYEEIKEAEDKDFKRTLVQEYQKYFKILTQYEPEALIEFDTVGLLTGDTYKINGIILDIELMKVAEILFEPSIIGITQPGLNEILEDFKDYSIKNILITGGFSKIKGLEERLANTLKGITSLGLPNIQRAKDFLNDPFKGADFVKTFPVYEIKDFKKKGAEKMMEENPFFWN